MAKSSPQKLNFTKQTIGAIKPPESGRSYVYDVKQSGLCICVTSTGSRTFYWYGRWKGRPERVKIGRFPDVSIENARDAAKGKASDVAKGIDPRRERTDGVTLDDLFKHWLAHAKGHKKTWREDERKWDSLFTKLAKRQLVDVEISDVAKWHRELGENHGPYLANRARALLSSIYGVAHELGYSGPNPCQGVRRFKEESRERFLLPDEMRPFFEALANELPIWRDFWLVCLFTGARRGNVASMAWRELDLTQSLWHIPGAKMKNGKPQVVALVPPVLAILESREDDRNGAEYVFGSGSGNGHVIDPRKSWARVVKRSGLENLRPHDLRRSLGSWQAIAGASMAIIGASLGHRDLKSTQVYARLQTDPVRQSITGAVQAMEAAGKVSDAVATKKPKRKRKPTQATEGNGNGKA